MELGPGQGVSSVIYPSCVSATPSLCLARECDCGRDVTSRLMQRREDLRSSVVALDGSDGRAQQLDPSDAGWAGEELWTAGRHFCGERGAA